MLLSREGGKRSEDSGRYRCMDVWMWGEVTCRGEWVSEWVGSEGKCSWYIRTYVHTYISLPVRLFVYLFVCLFSRCMRWSLQAVTSTCVCRGWIDVQRGTVELGRCRYWLMPVSTTHGWREREQTGSKSWFCFVCCGRWINQSIPPSLSLFSIFRIPSWDEWMKQTNKTNKQASKQANKQTNKNLSPAAYLPSPLPPSFLPSFRLSATLHILPCSGRVW